ncbi:MAG TPA: methylated-DNA--[protein]-cysteine S-methyltransferase [Steroidobacteraceae bacterium]|nr:methylated-DNA--[protein]-cysteine S-methyltransferase [Steroidobacteraceae bacterium]
MTVAAPPDRLALDRYASPMGDLLLASDDVGRLRGVDLFGDEARMTKWLRRQYGVRLVLERGSAPPPIREALDEYFAGRLDALDRIPCQADGTPFQQAVWTALRAIPAGQTISYGALAERLGNPQAVRAVGLANGSNPIPIVIPCHRVIGSDGSLTGYGGGLERKRWLLAHEGRHSPLLTQ